MKSYYQDKYSAVPATRRSVNKLLADGANLRLKGTNLTAITDNSTGVAANGYKAVPTQDQPFTHVNAVNDLALQSDFYVVAGKINNALAVLKGAINAVQTKLDSTRVITGGNGTVATAGTIPALEKTVDGTAGATAVAISRLEGNNAIKTMRNNMSTVLLAYNRLQDQYGRRRLADLGSGKASTSLVMVNGPTAGDPVDANGDVMSKAAADAAFGILVDNVAKIGADFQALQTAIAAANA